MSGRSIHWRGEFYVSVEDAARSFGITRTLIVEWVEHELIEPPRDVIGIEAIPARELERIAMLVRCAKVLELDARAIRALIELGHLQGR